VTCEEELKIQFQKLKPMMKGGCYGSTVLAINIFQVQSFGMFGIFLKIG
jgi:hypothetical protein